MSHVSGSLVPIKIRECMARDFFFIVTLTGMRTNTQKGQNSQLRLVLTDDVKLIALKVKGFTQLTPVADKY